jgi:hypothetical protein
MKTDTGPHYRMTRSVGALARYIEANKLVGLMHLPQSDLDQMEADAIKPGANLRPLENARLNTIRWLRELQPGQVVLLCAKLRIKVR